MNRIFVPTSKDISIQADGRLVAGVENYSSTILRKSIPIESFGSSHPIAIISQPSFYYIKLKKVFFVKSEITDGIDFHKLKDFNLVISKPNHKIIFSGCEWSEISETISINSPCIEEISLISSKRLETF